MDVEAGFLDRLFSNPALWGFLGVLAGGAITWAMEARRDSKERSRASSYSSALISAEIYKFVAACSEVAGDSGRPDQNGTFYVSTDSPEVDFSGLNVDWRSLQPGLADRVLSLPNKLRDVRSRLADIAEYTDPGDEESFIFERQLAYADLGVTAEELRQDVRKAAGLEIGPLSNSARFLNKQRRSLLAERAAIDARLAKQQASMPIPPPPASQD